MNFLTRREFLKAALLIAGGNFLSGCGNPKIEDEKINDIEINYLRQMITNDPSTSRTIIFQSDDILRKPAVEIDDKIFYAEEKFFTDDDHINNQYSVKIENLEAGKNYRYRIVDENHCGDWHELKTSDGKNFKAIIFPDSQCADYNVWKKVAETAFEKNPDVAFFINMGDLVDNGEDWTQWRSWFDGAKNFLDKIICVPILGNHECYNRQWKVREPFAYLNYFQLPRYYSFDFGDIHFAILDSQWSELEDVGGDGKNFILEQKNWLRKDISSTQKKRKIILIHKDVLQYRINGRPNRLEGFSDVGEEFMPLFDELNIDIVFTGHLHTYRDRGHIFDFKHDSRGPLYILTGIAGDVRYPNLWIDHALDVVTAPQPEVDNYLTLEFSNEKIIVKCFLSDGTEIDKAEI